MKRKMVSLKKMMMGLAGLMLTFSLMAQRGYNPGRFNADKPGMGHFCQAIPDLTPEQEQQINELRTMQIKGMNDFRSDLGIKLAELQKLQTSENVEMDQINTKIDEIGKINTEMAKKRAAHIQKVRALLTDEQRVIFDSRHGKPGHGMRRGMGRFHGSGEGFGPHCPHGRLK